MKTGFCRGENGGGTCNVLQIKDLKVGNRWFTAWGGLGNEGLFDGGGVASSLSEQGVIVTDG